MAGVGSQEWGDTREVMRTMQELYQHADEPATAVQIKEVISEVQALFAENADQDYSGKYFIEHQAGTSLNDTTRTTYCVEVLQADVASQVAS